VASTPLPNEAESARTRFPAPPFKQLSRDSALTRSRVICRVTYVSVFARYRCDILPFLETTFLQERRREPRVSSRNENAAACGRCGFDVLHAAARESAAPYRQHARQKQNARSVCEARFIEIFLHGDKHMARQVISVGESSRSPPQKRYEGIIF